jgi:hypothetical protein
MSKLYNALKKIDDYKTIEKKRETIKESDFVLKSVFQCAHSDAVKFLLPEGQPELKRNAKPKDVEKKMLYPLRSCTQQNIKAWQREEKFMNLLKQLSDKDRKVLVAMKDKTLTDLFPTLTKELVKEALPRIIR